MEPRYGRPSTVFLQRHVILHFSEHGTLNQFKNHFVCAVRGCNGSGRFGDSSCSSRWTLVVHCVSAPRNRGVRVPVGTQMDSANRCLAKLITVSKSQCQSLLSAFFCSSMLQFCLTSCCFKAWPHVVWAGCAVDHPDFEGACGSSVETTGSSSYCDQMIGFHFRFIKFHKSF